MKKIFRLSAIVAMLSMMATATVATSCSDDDDDADSTANVINNLVWTNATTKISATPGATVYAKNEGTVYTLKVVSAESGKVVVTVNGGSNIELSDAGTSYLGTDGKAMYQADAKAAPTKVLVCLLKGSTTLASATEAADSEIAKAANETKLQ